VSALTLPSGKEVRDLLAGLLSREVTVGVGVPIKASLDTPGMTSVFVDSTLRMCAILTLDIDLAAYAGAALSLMPARQAHAALAGRTLTDTLVENGTEIANVCASLLTAPGGSQARMYKTYAPGETLPADVVGAGMRFGARLDLTVDVAGYGSGCLSLVGV
jgi:hypothetical protein